MDNLKVEVFGKDPRVQKALSIACNVSVTKAPVIIVGEIGVGKRSLGMFIHENSSRSDQPLEVIDCSDDSQNVRNNILGFRDSETGRFSKGALELANGGTVIFANVDGLEYQFQKRLHQILNELDDYDIDIRVISTTTKNLSKMVGSGKFYRGLYTFILSNTIPLPPLRERIGDLETIAKCFIRDFHGSNVDGEVLSHEISQEALDKMVSHYWTHNLYELKIVLNNSLKESTENILKAEEIRIGEKKIVGQIVDEDNEGIRLMSLREAEKLLIKKALIHTSENRTQAAKILGVSIRTLRNKINEYRNSGNNFFVNLR